MAFFTLVYCLKIFAPTNRGLYLVGGGGWWTVTNLNSQFGDLRLGVQGQSPEIIKRKLMAEIDGLNYSEM